MIVYKIDVLKELKDRGFSSYMLQKECIFGAGSVQKLRENKLVSLDAINAICTLLQCEIGDIIEYKPSESDSELEAIATKYRRVDLFAGR